MIGSRQRMLVAAALTLACAAPARAAVVDSTAAGFTIRHEAAVAAAPDSAWRALLRVDRWWSGDHTFSGDAANLTLVPVPGGCFCERLPNGGVRHMTVVYAAPPKTLRLIGAIGPLQPGAVEGTMTWTLAARGTGTTIRVEYALGGYLPGGLGRMSRAVDAVLGQQLERLARLVERGRAAP